MQVNPKGRDKDSFRMIRGGCWLANVRGCCCEHRYSVFPSSMYNFFGFRVVMNRKALKNPVVKGGPKVWFDCRDSRTLVANPIHRSYDTGLRIVFWNFPKDL